MTSRSSPRYGVSAALLAMVTVIGACDGPAEGPPIQLVVNNRFGEDFDYGVLEVRAGGCDSADAPLMHRLRFPPAAMAGLDPAMLTLDRGEVVCFRVFAVLAEATFTPLECTLIAAGAQTVIVGESTEAVLDVLRLGAAPTGDAGATPSARQIVNEQYGPGICAPSLVSPFDGEHLGSTRSEICDRGDCALRPLLRFRHVAEAETYCIEMRPTRDGASPERESVPASDVGTDGFARFSWDRPGFAETDASYVWRVRACSTPECPEDGSAELTGGAERCTPWSDPRQLVTRPWGDLDGDDRSDFVLGDFSGDVHVFLSADSGGATETYEICGQPFYHRVVGATEQAHCDANRAISLIPSTFGAAVLIADVGGDDDRGEIIVGAPNCVEVGAPTSPSVGGGLFIYSGTGSELLGTHWFTEEIPGDEGPVGYGLHLQPHRRSSSDTMAIFVLGGGISTSGTIFRMTSLALGPSFSFDQGPIFTGSGYAIGIGDLDSDARQDIVGREQARFFPRGSRSPNELLTGFDGVDMLVAGDLDGDARSETLNLHTVDDPVVCEQTIAMESFAEGGGLVASGGSWTRELPFAENADCTLDDLDPMVPVDARCSTMMFVGPCDASEPACPSCFRTDLSEGAFAAVAPRGTVWSGGEPVVALMERDGLHLYDRLNTTTFADTLPRPAGSSSCIGRIMRGTLDLDGDGHDDMLVFDPDGDSLHVICGSESSPTLRRVETAAGDAFATAAGGCNNLWSIAP